MKKPMSARRERRGNPLLSEHVHDPYWSGTKLPKNTRCPRCGAVYRDGRWVWPQTEADWAGKSLCPACRRMDDHYPAGELQLSGAFVNAHRDEITSLARNIEKSENTEHPLHRIMDIRMEADQLTITTTDVHLPRRIGHALEATWGGALHTHYDKEGYFARVSWQRDD